MVRQVIRPHRSPPTLVLPEEDKDGTTRKNPKFIEKAKEAWNKSLGRRNGWIPNKDLAPAYGPQMVEVMNDESIMLTVNEAGVWSVTDRKQELQRRNSKRSNKSVSRGKLPHSVERQQFVHHERTVTKLSTSVELSYVES